MQNFWIWVKKNWIATASVLLFVIAALTAGYFYKQYSEIVENPQKVAQDQAAALLAEVGKEIELPTGETPTIETVNDLGPLKGQLFFANAKVGDKVLIYNTAKKAILYDPNANKIVEVAPIVFGTNPVDVAPTTAAQGTTVK